jgi:hypothetical protein
MLVKQCHKPPVWKCFIPPIDGDLGMVYGIVLPTLSDELTLPISDQLLLG